MDLCVLVRVHSRMADLEVCLGAIRAHWSRHRYHVVVLSSGRPDGFEVPDAIRRSCADVVELGDNPGHVAGTSRLLQAGRERVPSTCPYVVLLEADTWVHDDIVVDRYVRRLMASGRVWASATWVEKLDSLALDFALVQSAFFRAHAGLCAFESHAELHVSRYLADVGAGVLRIREHMPVHVPRLLRAVVDEPQGRFRCFPAGAMITHHIEDLPGGLEEKQRLANVTLGRLEYEGAGCPHLGLHHAGMVWLQRLARVVPRSSWFRPRRENTSTRHPRHSGRSGAVPDAKTGETAQERE